MKRTFTVEITFAGKHTDLPTEKSFANILAGSTVREALGQATCCDVFFNVVTSSVQAHWDRAKALVNLCLEAGEVEGAIGALESLRDRLKGGA